MSLKPTRLHLTERMCEAAVATALVAIGEPCSPLYLLFEHPIQLHVAVLATTTNGTRRLNGLGEDDLFRPFPVYNLGIGRDWKLPHYEIATNQAMKLWRGRNQNQTTLFKQMHPPEYIYTSCWGGVNKQGVTVSCSGPQAHLSQLFAEITASTIIALVHDAHGTLPENKEGILFQYIG